MGESITPSGVFSAIQTLREELGRGLDRVHERIDENNKNATEYFRLMAQKQADHEKEDAAEIARLKAEHIALADSISDAKGPGKLGWAGIGTAIASGAVALAKALIPHKGG